MRKLFLATAVGLLVASSASASPVYDAQFKTPRRAVLGDPVAIRVVNQGTIAVTMGETWDLAYQDGDGTAFYQWPEDELELEPGESRVWMWDQRVNQCYGECQNVREGDPALAGDYKVTTTIDGNEKTARFTLGQFFTVGFDHRPEAEFIVFVADQSDIDQMTAEAAKSDEEKTNMVTGVVRKGKKYNDDWNFTMGARSIELAEVSIEVCDGDPYYVQDHREEWLGQRWCPWSSYVKRVGK